MPTADQKLAYLEKQLSIETKVKEGAEKILPIYTSGSSRDKKLAAEAQLMLTDAKDKIEYIKLMINRLNKQKQDSEERAKLENGSTTSVSKSGNDQVTGDDKGRGSMDTTNLEAGDNSKLPQVMSSLDIRIEELRHRLKVECAVVEGAKNVIKLYQSSKLTDRKALQEAQSNLSDSSRKIDLLRKALEVCRQSLPQGSPKSSLLKADLDNSQSVAPTVYSPTIIFKKYDLASNSPIALTKPAAVTGKLEVRLIGCKDLLEDIPGRSRASASDLKSLVKAKSKGLSLSSSRSYSVKDETSNEIMAVLRLDNVTVGQTPWKACGQMAWDSRFTLNLERSRELEIQIHWHDWRSMCALKFLRLEEFVEDIRHGMALHLEPQGILFAEIKFIDPMVYRASKLQRQKLFRHKGKNILRPSQMNINVATWGRFIKRIPQANSSDSFSSPTSTLHKTPDKSDSRLSSTSSETESSYKSVKSSSSSETAELTSSKSSPTSISTITSAPCTTATTVAAGLSSYPTSDVTTKSSVNTATPTTTRQSHTQHANDQSQIKLTPSNASTLKVFDFLDEMYDNLNDSNQAIITLPGSHEHTPPSAEITQTDNRTSIHSIDENELARLKLRYSPGPEPIIDVPEDGDGLKTPEITVPSSRMTLDNFEFISVLGRGHFGKVILLQTYLVDQFVH